MKLHLLPRWPGLILLSGLLAGSLLGCAIQGIDRDDEDKLVQTFYASLLEVKPVHLRSNLDEGTVTGASFGLFSELDGDSEDMISGTLAGALIGSLFTAIEEGDSEAFQYRLYNPEKGELTVVSKQVLLENTLCVEVRQSSKVTLKPVSNELCHSASTDHSALAIVGAKVVRVNEKQSQNIMSDMTVLVKKGTISQLLKPEDRIPAGYKVIIAKDKWLLPGLIDGHVHLSQSGSAFTRPDMITASKIEPYEADQLWLKENLTRILNDYTKLGITTVIDLGGPSANLIHLQNISCMSSCPDIHAAAELISSAPVEELQNEGVTFLSVNKASEAVAAVRMQAQLGARISKFVWTNEAGLTPQQLFELYQPAMSHARDSGLIVAVHVQDLEYAKMAIRAGADLLVHGVMTSEIDDEFISLALENDVTYVPTLTAYEHYLHIFQNRLSFSDFERKVADEYILDSFKRLYDEQDKADPMFQALLRYVPFVDKKVETLTEFSEQEQALISQLSKLFSSKILSFQRENLRAVLDAGINVGFGTDAGNPGTLHAVSMDGELNAWLESGVSSKEIINAMTYGNAKAYGLSDSLGDISIGNKATFNLLSSDPLTDITNIFQPSAVFKSGELVNENK